MTLPRVLFVTGKGGTGKSTVAAALALARSRRRPTTLADLDRRMCAAAMLGVTSVDGTAAKVTNSLEVIALGARAELDAFIGRIVPIRAISRRMLRSRTFGYVTASLPGLEAFLLLERLRIMAGDAALDDRYLVIDAPASGNALELLSVAAGVKNISPTGTLNRIADSVAAFLADPMRFGVIITLTPEELALREALETEANLRERLSITTVAAIMNRVPDSLFNTTELAALSPLGIHGRLAVRRNASQEVASAMARRLAKAGIATINLPMMFTPAMGRKELEQLGQVLAAEL